MNKHSNFSLGRRAKLRKSISAADNKSSSNPKVSLGGIAAFLAIAMLLSSTILGGLAFSRAFAQSGGEEPTGETNDPSSSNSGSDSESSTDASTNSTETTSEPSEEDPESSQDASSGSSTSSTSETTNSTETSSTEEESTDSENSGNTTSSDTETAQDTSSGQNATATEPETASSETNQSSTDPQPAEIIEYNPLIWTDKDDYPPGALVTIYGSGFIESTAITLSITHPDNNLRVWTTNSDTTGGLETTYQLDGFAESYTVTATDGTNSATTVFTDGTLVFDQTGLPSGASWSVSATGLMPNPKSATAPSDISFGANAGSYPYSIPNVVFGGNTYVPSPSSGTAVLATSSAQITVFVTFSLAKATPSITTEVHDSSHGIVSSLTLGNAVHDKAILSGGNSPTGDVTFHLYQTGDCTGSFSSETVALTGLVSESTIPASPLGAGSYSYNATYNGDTNNNKVTSACEPFTVTKAKTTVTTEIHDNSVVTLPHLALGLTGPLGIDLHDNATVSGEVSGFPLSGTITYHFYNSIDCTGSFAVSGPLALGSESSPTGSLAAGEYSFNATYGGDGNYERSESDCEEFTVEKATPGIVTDIHDNSVVTLPHASVGTSAPLGTSVHDNATLSEIISGFPVTGTTTYNFYEGSDQCTGSFTAETVAVGSESSATGALGAGLYSYNATYHGDSNYNKVTSACEPLTIQQADTTVTTDIHDHSDATLPHTSITTSVPLGTNVHDNATVSGEVAGFPLTGTVSYHFYSEIDCTGSFVASSSLALGSESSASGPLGAGSYSFNATYSGDVNYKGSTSDCEPLTVDQAATTITTEIHDDSDATIPHTPVGLAVIAGITVHDNSTVSGEVSGFPISGTVRYHFYETNDCTGSFDDSGPLALGSESPAEGPLAAGAYSFNASYSGDTNYIGSTSDCEPLNVFPINRVSTSGLCTFDATTDAGRQFKLIYPPDGAGDPTKNYKLVASNPGQFYYNAFYTGSGDQTVTLTIPYPFVTQGAVPLHLYSGASYDANGCFVPSGEIYNRAISISIPPSLKDDNNSPTANATITVTFDSPTDFFYLNLHLDYGQKSKSPYTKDSSNNAVDPALTSNILIHDLGSYTFAVSGDTSGSETVFNKNVFKRDPGFTGVVASQTTGPIANVKVQIFDAKGKLFGTAFTNADGYYLYNYKYTGKAITFTVKLPDYPSVPPQTVTLKSNSFAIANFLLP